MKVWMIVSCLFVLSACGQQDNLNAKGEKGAFEAYTDSQVEALQRAKGVEDELNKADEARRKQLEQVQ
ncbi:hypothetical protein [Gilvimarinus agarilyticus]|uniref:hypothetical protein n=1 Tax=Gilvimarinus agarilyticus TaxID=679259 RepID=UPI0005A257C5|nr:hypothetical protein [Gilvimarinus agarilyticus]